MLELERGSQIITREQLHLIEPVMQATRTFVPVPHGLLADRLLIMAQDILNGYDLVSETYTVARYGNQCFAVLTFSKGDEGIYFSVGWRNSNDKSLACAIVLGAQVICCSNLMLDGEIKILRRHSQKVWQDIEMLAITSFYRHTHAYDNVLRIRERLRRNDFTDRQAAHFFGRCYFDDILSPRQIPVAVEQWKRPTFEEFNERTAWSAYNAVTYALKSEAPATAMEKHVQASQMLIDL
jgi:hypothetical protein